MADLTPYRISVIDVFDAQMDELAGAVESALNLNEHQRFVYHEFLAALGAC